jgi:hypothetical protein
MPPKKTKSALPVRLKKPKKVKKLKINPKKHISVFDNILHPYLRYDDKERQINIDNKLVREDSDYESDSSSSSSSGSDSEDEFKPVILMGDHRVKKSKDEEVHFKGVDISYIPTNKDAIEQRYLMRENIIPRGYSNFIILNGSIGSGKTNCLVNMLLNPLMYGFDAFNKHWFDNVFVLTNSNDDAYDTLIEKGVLKKSNIKHLPTSEDLKQILDQQKKAIKMAGADQTKIPNTCIIMDDVIDDKNFINSKEFKLCAIRPRQLFLCCFLLSQHFTAIPRINRVNAQNLILFNGTRTEQEMYSDMLTPAGVTKKQFEQVLNYAWEKRPPHDNHSFLHVNRKAPIESRFYRNFKEKIHIKAFEKPE